VTATPPAVGSPPDPGLFGPGSVTWRVHADLSMFVGGLRALLVQTLHPRAMAAVAEHSSYREDPLGRLHRTSAFIAATTYGTRAEAEGAVANVRRIHEQVRGVAPDGHPYSASDPELLAWVHAVEVDSFLTAYLRYGAGLDDDDADRYVDEMAVVGQMVGVEDPPRRVAALHAELDGFDEVRGTGQARDAVRFILFPPLPIVARPAHAILAAAAVGLVPPDYRRMLWLPALPLTDPLVVRPATRAFLAGLGWALGENPTLARANARCAASFLVSAVDGQFGEENQRSRRGKR
ncbi:MAG: oxygenase MpaB family protein, partial [Candidatus Rokuibacteriota bacterium]